MQGVRIEFTRPDGGHDSVEVYVPGQPTNVSRINAAGASANPARPGSVAAAGGARPEPPPAWHGPPPGPPPEKPRDWMQQVNAAREHYGLDSAEGSAKLREAIGEKFTLDAGWAWVSGTPGRTLDGLMRAAAGITLPKRGGGR